jgi:hypothetical protein
MSEKNSFWRKLLAFFLSILVIAIIFPTIFSAPLEFVVMNADTYSALTNNDKLLDAGQDAFSAYIAGQLNQPGETEIVPPAFRNTELLTEVIKPFVTKEWMSKTLNDVAGQLLQFLNFKQPFGIVRIDLTEIKASVLAERDVLVENLLSASVPCDAAEIAKMESGTLSITSMPLCNPPAEVKSKVVAAISDYVEEFLYKIPQEYRINIEDGITTTNYKNPLLSYSLLRWTFRILPILSLVLLIAIAVILRKNGTEMCAWLGRLLTTAAIISLVLILVLLIGSEQFTALFINQVLSAENGSFGTLLLIVLQAVTYRTLLWMGAISIALLCVGLIILFFNRLSTRRTLPGNAEEESQFEGSADDILKAKQAMAEEIKEEIPTQDEKKEE